MTGWRYYFFKFWYQWCSLSTVWIAGFYIDKKERNVDYSYYLGPDYQKQQTVTKKPGVIVCNHLTWLDSVILIVAFYTGFVAKAEILKVPLLNKTISGLQSVFIQRAGTEEEKQKCLDLIKERQILVEKDPRYPYITIYPEGTQSNGDHLLTFKKGAFASLMAVQPVVLKYRNTGVNMCWQGISVIQHILVNGS